MNTEAIELICEKLGTTVEHLVPTVIDYLTHRANVCMAIGVAFAVVGAFLIMMGFIIDRHGDATALWFFGWVALVIGALTFGISLYCKHLVTTYPQISAYKEIFSWITSGC